MLNAILAISMEEFFHDYGGVALFIALDIIIALLIIIIAYRWVFKHLFDFIAGLVATVATLPVWLPIVIISKVHIIKTGEYDSVLRTYYVAGKKGKPVKMHAFTVAKKEDGQLTKLGAFLRKSKLENLPVVFDLLLFKISVVGVKPLSVLDEKFVAEEDYARFFVRPGLVNPTVAANEDNAPATYEEMFAWDKRYERKYSFFGDIFILFSLLVRKIRGQKQNFLNEITQKGYAQTLLDAGEITREDFDEARNETKNFLQEENFDEARDENKNFLQEENLEKGLEEVKESNAENAE